MCGKVKGQFPGFLPKTDETRVQVLDRPWSAIAARRST
jgi:hypothetical protein